MRPWTLAAGALLASILPAQAQEGRAERLEACREEAQRMFQVHKTFGADKTGPLRREHVAACMARAIPPERRARSEACRARAAQAVSDTAASTMDAIRQQRMAHHRRCMGG